jgi:hypothetical protein
MRIHGTLVGILAACSVLTVTTAYAADPVIVEDAPVAEQVSPGWTVAIDPLYTWLPGFNGDATIFGNDISIDITSRDILHHIDDFLRALDGLYMGSGEARNGNFGLQYDIVYLSLGGSKDLTLGPGPITGGVDLGFKLSMTTLAGNYRFYETQNAYLDAIAGIRIMDVQTDLALTIGPGGLSASDGDTWVDPVVGVKGRYDLNENWYMKGSALYGGFGVSSHSLYDVAAFVGYEWANGIELYGGWRVADTKYDNGSFKWDITMSGPMLGLTFKF